VFDDGAWSGNSVPFFSLELGVWSLEWIKIQSQNQKSKVKIKKSKGSVLLFDFLILTFDFTPGSRLLTPDYFVLSPHGTHARTTGKITIGTKQAPGGINGGDGEC
jgi:hypothetical protein